MADIADMKGVARRGTQPQFMTFGQTQQLLIELPKAIDMLQEQTENIQKIMKRQLATTQKQETISESNVAVLGLIHDRLDALAVESRVTNLLLAELVAIQQTVVAEDTDRKREVIRNAAYAQILNAQ